MPELAESYDLWEAQRLVPLLPPRPVDSHKGRNGHVLCVGGNAGSGGAVRQKRELTGIPGLPPPLVDLPPGCSFNPRCPLAFDRCVRETPLLQQVGPAQRAACHLYPDRTSLPPMPPMTRAHQEVRP